MRMMAYGVLVAAALGVGCAHAQTVYQVGPGGGAAVAVGERHGRQIWMYDGDIAYVDANNHVRLPSFQDAVLDGDRLRFTPQADRRNLVVTVVGFGSPR